MSDEENNHGARARYSTQALVDRVLDPRDPGYAAARERNGGVPARHWYDGPAVALGALIIGVMLSVAYVHTHRSAPEAAKVHSGLVARVRTAEHTNTTLAASAQRLNSQLSALRDTSLPDSGALTRSLDVSALVAGQTAVTGPGLQVVLSDPKTPASAAAGRGAAAAGAASNILTDRDVRSVVNELWADGAEAISVNGVRLTPTSAIRFAGQAVLVDFEPITSPYTVEAIGPADKMDTAFASSDVASRYQTLSGADGVGFSFRERSRLNLPASPAVTLRYAHAVGGGK